MMFARALLLEFIAAAVFERISRLEGGSDPCPRGAAFCCRECAAAYDLSEEAWS